jgi:hypothetical protein
MAKPRLVTGLFRDRDSAERAYDLVTQRGYHGEDINLVMTDSTRERYFTEPAPRTELGTKAAKGAGIGGAIGGSVGAVAAALAAVGTSLAIPALGVVIAGPIAAALAGAGAGAATGGLVGALVGWGIPEDRVKQYESLQQGGILMSVKPRSDDDARYFERKWRDDLSAQHVHY